jgi:endonuclease/exonuclease/phosphatase family metal-dependent hydrolase
MTKRLARLAVVLVVAIATVVTGAATAAAAAEITLGTHNSHYGDGSFERFAGVIGWQEVNDPEDRRKLDNRLGAEYNTFYPADGPAKAVPISWRVERFAKVGQGSVRTHGGEAGVTPARYVNWVILELRGTGTRFIVVNTHFISGAWSGHPERQARWNTHYQVLHDTVARLRQNHPNKPVFVLGDFNRRKAMPMPAPVKYVPVQGADGVPIDHMYAPTTIQHSQVTRLPTWGSDHHAYKMSATV